MKRDALTREGVKEWMRQQWSEEKVREKCDFEINNDGIADLNKQIDILLNKL
jgi:dephospho-CoA kinase